MEQLKKALLSFVLLLASTAIYSQTEITGSVVDDLGEGVIGATVMEKDTSNGTVTDLDGNFKLNVEAGKTLVISYIGYMTQELPAADGMRVVIKEDAQSLNELVVVGYTTQKKADLTGAISTVSVDDLAKQNENNPIKAMQGRVPGMNIAADGSPSGSATVRIRGIGTLNNNDPLYIIDGVPTKAGMHELNGNDIESIQVLKDAASASIYGSRAANGVIIITTKKGKEGKVHIDFDGSLSVQTYAHKMEVLNAKQFGQVMWQGYVNDGLDPNQNGLGYHYDWSYNQQGAPVLNNITMSKYLDMAGTTPAADTDWFDQTTRTGLAQQYNVSLSNGSERGTSFFSLGYYNNKEKTSEAFVQNPLHDLYEDKIYRTGDIVKYNSRGELEFVSRKDFQVKHNGNRIELGEIEVAINALDDVTNAACIHDSEEDKIVLYYTTASGNELDIINLVKDRLPKYMFPNVINRIDVMPHNMNGKIDRIALKQQYQQQK